MMVTPPEGAAPETCEMRLEFYLMEEKQNKEMACGPEGILPQILLVRPVRVKCLVKNSELLFQLVDVALEILENA